MRFKNKQEQLAHSTPRLIFENLCSEIYASRSFSIANINLENDYNDLPDDEKKKIWLLTLLFNQDKKKEWIDFAKNYLQLSSIDLLIIVTSLKKLTIFKTFTKDTIESYLEILFKKSVENGDLAIIKYWFALDPQQIQAIICAWDFQVFRSAAEKGNLDIIKYLAELLPNQLPSMICAWDFHAFRCAADNGHLTVINYLVEIASEQLLVMVSAIDFYAFRSAAINGHLTLIKYLAEITPAQLPQMISAINFHTFRGAAVKGHLAILKYLAEITPAQLPAMISAGNFHAFRGAASKGHLAIIKYLAEVAPSQLPEMVKAGNFQAFRGAAENGHLAIIKYLAELASAWLPAMISNENFHVFRSAAEHGHFAIIQYLAELAHAWLPTMISAADFYAFRCAAENGHLAIVKYLSEANPQQLFAMITAKNFQAFLSAAAKEHLAMIRYLAQIAPTLIPAMYSADDFSAFRYAAANGQLAIVKCLVEIAPGQINAMVSACDFEAFCHAAENGHLIIVKYLAEIASSQISPMISARDFYAFRHAAVNGHLAIIKYFVELTSEHLPAMISAEDFCAFRWSFAQNQVSVVDYLLSFSKSYSYIERYIDRDDYLPAVIRFTTDFLRNLQKKINDFQMLHKHGVFDFVEVDGAVDNEKALYGYYVLRQLIRQLPNNRYGDEVYFHIHSLLTLPSIKYLVLLNATKINLPSTYRYAQDNFAEQTNELLRLAINNNNERVIRHLLAIPALFEAAQHHGYYPEASARLKLTELAHNKVLFTLGLNHQEQVQVKNLELTYQEKIAFYPKGIKSVINELRAFLEQAFLAEEHLTLRQANIRNVIYTLPVDYSTLTAWLKIHAFKAAEIQQIKAVYYKNIYHTAWRYLSKPNCWMHPQALYGYVNEAGRWSTFEEYQSLIAYLWIAASDSHYSSLEKNITVSQRRDLFIQQLALINRAYNWNKSRVKLMSDGKPVFDAHHNPVMEKYDDLEDDKPASFSGEKRHLFQALLEQPLNIPVALTHDEQFLKEILNEVQKALSQYKDYHRSHDSDSEAETRIRLGFFVNETKNFPKAAAFCEMLQADIEKTGSLVNALHTLKGFFEMSSQTFYSHSFTSYLASALAKLQLITLRAKNHYTQLEVVSELETRLVVHLSKQAA